MTYRIRTVAEMTGIPRNTLIAWERRYGLVRPTRHENGYRSYSDEDVSRLMRVKNAQAAGLKVSEAIALLQRGQDLNQAGVLLSEPVPSPEAQLSQLKNALVDALVSYDKEGALAIMTQLTAIPFARRLETVFFPVLREIGDRWERGVISIVEEHYASSVIRTHFASLLLAVGPSSPHAVHAACTTFPDEQHELVALGLAIQLSLDGYRVSYLGPSLPAAEAVRFVQQQDPRLFCVSVVLPVSADAVRNYATQVAPALGPKAVLVLGGKTLEGISLGLPNVHIRPEWGIDFDLSPQNAEA